MTQGLVLKQRRQQRAREMNTQRVARRQQRLRDVLAAAGRQSCIRYDAVLWRVCRARHRAALRRELFALAGIPYMSAMQLRALCGAAGSQMPLCVNPYHYIQCASLYDELRWVLANWPFEPHDVRTGWATCTTWWAATGDGAPVMGVPSDVRKQWGRKINRATQVSWSLFYNQPFPDGKNALHYCDNRLCVNPLHIYAGTNNDNVNDRVTRQRGRTRVTQAEMDEVVMLLRKGVSVETLCLHVFGSGRRLSAQFIKKVANCLRDARPLPRTLIDPDKIVVMRQRRATGTPYAVLAREYGVSTSTVWYYVKKTNQSGG